MTGSDSLVSRSTRPRSVLLAGLLALLLCCVAAGAAQAAPVAPTDAALPGSNFQGGDGDQDAENGLDDWETLVGSMGLVHASDPNALDSTFGTGSHEDKPINWDLLVDPDGVTPAKANFFNSWSYVDELGDTFLYLAFDRQDSGGNVFLAFELNQDTRLWTNASGDQIQCRTTGDIIVSYEIQNDDNIDVIIQRWVSDTVVSAAEAAGGLTNGTGCAKTGHFEEFDPPAGTVQGAINGGREIDNFLPRTPPLTELGEELFGEAALNLTDIFEGIGANPCFSFGQISLHGRSSESDDAALQDVIGPVPLLVRNCTASGTKYHDLNANGDQDAGEPGLPGFRIWADYDNDGVLDAGEPFDDTDADGDYTITNIQDPSGTYSLREKLTPPATGTGGWICSEPTTTGPNGDFPCAYTADRRQRHAERQRQGLRQLQEADDHRREADRARRRGRLVRVHVDDPRQGELQPDRRAAELDRGHSGRLHGDRDGAGGLVADRHRLLGRHDRAELERCRRHGDVQRPVGRDDHVHLHEHQARLADGDQGDRSCV